jgi:phage nucleotide-binding protein
MQCSHSRIECFEKCPFKYKLRYRDKILTLPPENADSPLIIGTALHTGLEKGVTKALDEYFMSYPIITDDHINEAMKLENLIPRAAKLIPKGNFEVKISTEDFIGYIDLLAPVTMFHESEVPNQYDIYDFKYSNNISNYKQSDQLHLYKYFFEKCNPGKYIRNLFFLFVPKVNIKQKKTEDLSEFRKRILDELKGVEPELVQIEYDPNKVINFLLNTKHTIEATDFNKNPGYLCNYCEYQNYCEKGIDYMLLPSKERRNIAKIEKKVIWMYGSPFSGKTTFANKFPDPLMLNTDGNIKFVDAPFIAIKDKVEPNGRMSPKRTFAWDVFKEVIEELEKKDNDFKTIIVDLLEDCYEHCRLYMYDQMGITHESDDSFRAWDKVQTEFLSTLKKLMNLDYENIILISHEDTSKDITKKGGDKITAIKPNLREKVANKVAGMVDIVARVIADGDVRTLSFKTNEVIFGGGRLTVSTNEIPLDYEAFREVYDEANKNAVAVMNGEAPAASASTERKGRQKKEKTPEPEAPKEETSEADTKEEPAAEPEKAEEPKEEPKEEPSEPKPVTKTRKRRGE